MTSGDRSQTGPASPEASATKSGRAAFPRPFGSRYQLLRHLATGGMADVFLARQIGRAGFVKECVIKRILPNLARDKQFVEMFLDEARLAARLNHPNIAQVYDQGQEGDDYFIAMEFVEGVDLERILDLAIERGEKGLPFDVAARIVAGIAEGLEHAHHAIDDKGQPLGLVHRDVTPSNIVVSFEGVPKLLDFGIAKASSKATKTEVGIIKGKLPYMSPEQVSGERLDARADIFSLGVLLYELTTGQKPFEGENAAQLGVRILHDEPLPPTLVVEGYPEALEEIVLKALAKKPAERVQSGRAMQKLLEKFITTMGGPTTSHEVAEYLMTRFVRHPITMTGVASGRVRTDGGAPGAREGDDKVEPEHRQTSRPTGPLSLGEGPIVDDIHAGRRETRRSLGGGGGWIMGGAAVVVVGVAVLFFALRGYEQKKEQATAVDASLAGTVIAPPAAPPATPPPVAPSAPEKPAVAPEKPAAVEPAPKNTAPEEPAKAAEIPAVKVTPLPTEPAKPIEKKPAPKSTPTVKKAPQPAEPKPLPKLPRLPVPAPEEGN